MNSVARYPVHVHYGYQQATLYAVDSVSYNINNQLDATITVY